MSPSYTSSHALFDVLSQAGVDRVFLVPGESYLGLLDALVDFPEIDTVTCRHEGGAGFMAVADGRLSRRPGVALVSRGPGASNATIAVHTAQQDAVGMILLIGQIAEKDLRREAFQEIDYQQMFGSIAKWVFECRHPEQLGQAAAKAVRVAMSGVPGPVVLVLPEDIQQQAVEPVKIISQPQIAGIPDHRTRQLITDAINQAQRPLIMAGGMFDAPGGREALQAFAEHFQIPVILSFRRHDILTHDHPLFVGTMGLANPARQMALLEKCDFLLALGTRLGDITTQNYVFPSYGTARQKLLHCYPDSRLIGWDTQADFPLVADPVGLARALTGHDADDRNRDPDWLGSLRAFHTEYVTWPAARSFDDGLDFTRVVQTIMAHASPEAMICLDAGTFAAPVYRYAPFIKNRRLVAPLAGAMGYGTPAALACAMRYPGRQVICMVGDGGLLMTGQEMILAVERQLPIVMVVSCNGTYGSIRLHQEVHYPGRISGTSLHNPDFVGMAQSFGMRAIHLNQESQLEQTITNALKEPGPILIQVQTSVNAILPQGR